MISRGIKPKTANRYREIMSALVNLATTQSGIRMPGGINPATAVKRYKESPPEIRFLTLPQVKRQLDVLAEHQQLQTSNAHLRRPEAGRAPVADDRRRRLRHGHVR